MSSSVVWTDPRSLEAWEIRVETVTWSEPFHGNNLKKPINQEEKV